VYYGTADALLRGIVPYRDFVSVHPPFSSILLGATSGPIGVLWGPRVGFLSARVLAALAGAVKVWLLYRCASRLVDRRAAVLTSVLYTTFTAAVFAESRVLLDPFMVVLAVAAVTVFLERESRAGALVAGALFGLSVSTKLTGAVFFLAAVIVGLARPSDRRRALDCAGAALGTFTLVVADSPDVQLTWSPDTQRWFVATHRVEGLSDRFTVWRTIDPAA